MKQTVLLLLHARICKCKMYLEKKNIDPHNINKMASKHFQNARLVTEEAERKYNASSGDAKASRAQKRDIKKNAKTPELTLGRKNSRNRFALQEARTSARSTDKARRKSKKARAAGSSITTRSVASSSRR